MKKNLFGEPTACEHLICHRDQNTVGAQYLQLWQSTCSSRGLRVSGHKVRGLDRMIPRTELLISGAYDSLDSHHDRARLNKASWLPVQCSPPVVSTIGKKLGPNSKRAKGRAGQFCLPESLSPSTSHLLFSWSPASSYPWDHL